MSKHIKLKKGFDINLLGKAEKKVAGIVQPETFAIKPTDFIGMVRPKVLLKEGDTVKAGTPILFDRQMEQVMYSSPVSGEIVEVKRGERRKLLEIKILADKQVEFEEYPKYTASELSGVAKEDMKDIMLKSGVWPNIIQRPYGVVADPEEEPKAIFVSAFDSHPLAPDYDFLFKNEEQYFQAGLDVLKKFTPGIIHVNIDGKAEVSKGFSQVKGAQINKFSGPHPAGNVGVQIHHLDPINKGDIAWTIKPAGVIQIGKLFLEGRYDASRLVALTGSEIKNPQYYKTYSGACIDKFVNNNLKTDNVRFISGNVLTGENIGKTGYLGYYDQQITVIPEGDYHEFLGWIMPSAKLSFHRAFGLMSFLNPKKEYILDTNTRGEERAFVQTGVFEKVVPMDIYPTHLLKAILADDYDEMEALGIFEVIEEDLALCEFVDVSKHKVQEILREGLHLIQNG